MLLFLDASVSGVCCWLLWLLLMLFLDSFVNSLTALPLPLPLFRPTRSTPAHFCSLACFLLALLLSKHPFSSCYWLSPLLAMEINKNQFESRGESWKELDGKGLGGAGGKRGKGECSLILF